MKYLRAVGVLLSTAILYLGLPLLGWGVNDLQGFLSLYPRAGYALVVATFSLLVGIQALNSIEGITGSSGVESKLIRRQSIIGHVLVLILYLALIFLPFSDRHNIGSIVYDQTLRWIGLALCAFGYLLIFWSGLALGRQYSVEVTIQKDHQLITSGPYRTIRHPRYLGILSLAFGMSLLFNSLIGLAIYPLIIWLIIDRIKDEEYLMQKEFGDTWRTYCQKTWRLIPYIF